MSGKVSGAPRSWISVTWRPCRLSKQTTRFPTMKFLLLLLAISAALAGDVYRGGRYAREVLMTPSRIQKWLGELGLGYSSQLGIHHSVLFKYLSSDSRFSPQLDSGSSIQWKPYNWEGLYFHPSSPQNCGTGIEFYAYATGSNSVRAPLMRLVF